MEAAVIACRVSARFYAEENVEFARRLAEEDYYYSRLKNPFIKHSELGNAYQFRAIELIQGKRE